MEFCAFWCDRYNICLLHLWVCWHFLWVFVRIVLQQSSEVSWDGPTFGWPVVGHGKSAIELNPRVYFASLFVLLLNLSLTRLCVSDVDKQLLCCLLNLSLTRLCVSDVDKQLLCCLLNLSLTRLCVSDVDKQLLCCLLNLSLTRLCVSDVDKQLLCCFVTGVLMFFLADSVSR